MEDAGVLGVKRQVAVASGTTALVLAMLACTPALEPASGAPPPRAKLEIPPPVPSEAPQPEAPAAVAGTPEIREPESPACRIPEPSWSFDALRLAEDGVVFAGVSRAPTTVVLPSGEPRAATAVFDDTQVLLRAIVNPNELALFAGEAAALRGFLVPKPSTRLRWSGGHPGALRVGVEAKSVLAWPALVEDELGCEKIALNKASFVARELVTKRAQLPERIVTRSGAELSVAPGDAAVAGLRDRLRVEVVQTEGTQSRVLIEDPSFSAFGWVHSADLGPAPLLNGHGRLGGSHRTIAPSIRGGRSCLHDLSLFGEIGEERARIGVLRKGSPFFVEAPRTEPEPDTGAPPARGAYRATRYVSIRIPRARWLTLGEGARLLVPEDEYRECDVKAPPEGQPRGP